jgi:hypothetical protein
VGEGRAIAGAGQTGKLVRSVVHLSAALCQACLFPHTEPHPQAPATLLAISRDLPPGMARREWNLRDYGVVEKMYTGG